MRQTHSSDDNPSKCTILHREAVSERFQRMHRRPRRISRKLAPGSRNRVIWSLLTNPTPAALRFPLRFALRNPARTRS